MIEELKMVRDALQYCKDWYQGGDCIDEALATLDRIIADHIPDASKMAVPDGYALVPIEPTGEMPWIGRDILNALTGGNYTCFVAESIYKAMTSAAPTPAPVDQSKYPYDRSEYVVMPPIRKAEDGTLTTDPQNVDRFTPKHSGSVDSVDDAVIDRIKQPTQPPIDVEALKREVTKANQDVNFTLFNDHIKWVIDYIAAAGYLRAPLPRIEGLEEEIRDDDKLHEIIESHKRLNDPPRLLSKTQQAARAYLKASGV